MCVKAVRITELCSTQNLIRVSAATAARGAQDVIRRLVATNCAALRVKKQLQKEVEMYAD